MRVRTLKANYIRYRYLPGGQVALTLARRPRAFVLSSCGNYQFLTGAVGDFWLEIDLAEAINLIVASRFYTHDDRHPVIAKINSLMGASL